MIAPRCLRWLKLCATGVTITTLLVACAPSEPEPVASPPEVRRLDEEQYRKIIADVFGPAIVVGGRFDTLVRTEGLLALGARKATVTSAGFQQLEETARSIAAQVVTLPHSRFLMPCDVTAEAEYDAECTRRFLSKFGRLLFRRPLTDEEVAARVEVVESATRELGSFQEGAALGVASLLVAPQFLFVTDHLEEHPERPGEFRLDAYSIATRLSIFLWNTAPDDMLLKAAESGELHDPDGLREQVSRMLDSPRLEAGVRAFFSDMFGFSEFEFLEKDSVIYPAFGVAAARDAKEQTLRTTVEHVVHRDGDYRDLFTTRETFMTKSLGLLYRVPVGAPEGVWEPYEFAPDSGRRGIQSQIGFVALHAHPGRSSPTLRGKAIREALLCQKVPPPPPDVDFSGFNDPNSPNKTARDRLSAHAVNAACAGCHKITDPIGLAMENFDGAGKFRTTEEGEKIDASGSLDGISFDDPVGLASALRDNPAATECLVNRLFAYGVGRTPSVRDPSIDYFNEMFAANDYSVTSLMEGLANSKAFLAVEPSDSVQHSAVALNE